MSSDVNRTFSEKLEASSVGQGLAEIDRIMGRGIAARVVHTLDFDWHDQKRDYYARSLCGIWAWDMPEGHVATDDQDRVTCEACRG